MQLLKPKDVRVCAFWLNLLYKSLLEYNKTVKASSYINVYKRMDAGAAGHSTQLRSRVIKIYNQILYRESLVCHIFIHQFVVVCFITLNYRSICVRDGQQKIIISLCCLANRYAIHCFGPLWKTLAEERAGDVALEQQLSTKDIKLLHADHCLYSLTCSNKASNCAGKE